MKNILLPTDFSDCANNAFVYALKIANQLQLNLYVLHSYQSPVLSFSHAGQPEFLATVYSEIEISNFEKFKTHTQKLHEIADANGLSYSNVIFLFEEGPLIDSIKKVVVKEEIGFIVMGTLGASGFKQKFIGTNTVNVINEVQIPVLAIPQKAVYNGINKIAFTTLFREADLDLLKETLAFSSFFGGEVSCVHVVEENSSPADILQHSEHWRKSFGEKQLDFVLLEKDQTVEKTIHDFITANKIDVLTVIKRNRSFFDKLVRSSLSSNLAFHIETPILIFNENQI